MGQLDKAGCNRSRVPGGSVWRDCFLFLTRVATTLPSETTKFKPVPPQLRRLEPAPANPNRQAVPPFLNSNLHRILRARSTMKILGQENNTAIVTGQCCRGTGRRLVFRHGYRALQSDRRSLGFFHSIELRLELFTRIFVVHTRREPNVIGDGKAARNFAVGFSVYLLRRKQC
jgi:hypothetical protein